MFKQPLRYSLLVRVLREKKCFGPGIAQLLQLVRETQSLRAATMSMNMAYSKAWIMMKTAEEQLGFKLLISTTGGKGGGGAMLTPEAEQLLEDYAAFRRDVVSAADELFEKYFGKYQ